jgi:hypothetical protein
MPVLVLFLVDFWLPKCGLVAHCVCPKEGPERAQEDDQEVGYAEPPMHVNRRQRAPLPPLCMACYSAPEMEN